jgi:hypothetical protein
MKRLFVLFAILALAVGAGAAMHTCPDCLQSTVQDTINIINATDTVYVPAGTATWPEQYTGYQGKLVSLEMNRGITLIGGHGGTTTITVTGTFNMGAIQYYPNATARSNNEKFDLQGFTFDGNNENHIGGIVDVVQYSSTLILSNVKIHHNIFKNEVNTGIETNGPVFGVAYSNTFDRVENTIRNFGGDASLLPEGFTAWRCCGHVSPASSDSCGAT